MSNIHLQLFHIILLNFHMICLIIFILFDLIFDLIFINTIKEGRMATITASTLGMIPSLLYSPEYINTYIN